MLLLLAYLSHLVPLGHLPLLAVLIALTSVTLAALFPSPVPPPVPDIVGIYRRGSVLDLGGGRIVDLCPGKTITMSRQWSLPLALLGHRLRAETVRLRDALIRFAVAVFLAVGIYGVAMLAGQVLVDTVHSAMTRAVETPA